MTDNKLWKQFSRFIRLRDADENGYCTCITCGAVRHWKLLDCGHGIPRQYWATRYSEKNNAAQCKKCNGFEGGRREDYKIAMDKKYGAGTWDLMEVLSKTTNKRPSQTEVDILTKFYKQEADKLEKQKS